MPTVAIAIQLKDGANLLLSTRAILSGPQALELTTDFAAKIGQLRVEDFGPMGPRKVEPNFAKGRVSVLKRYQAVYTLINDLYIIAFQNSGDNPFHSDAVLVKTIKTLEGLCRSDVTVQQLQKKYAEALLALDKILNGEKVEEKSDWEQVEKVYRDQRMRAEALGLVELKLPPNVSIETPTPTFDFDASFNAPDPTDAIPKPEVVEPDDEDEIMEAILPLPIATPLKKKKVMSDEDAPLPEKIKEKKKTKKKKPTITLAQ